jgi:hypothetical protein
LRRPSASGEAGPSEVAHADDPALCWTRPHSVVGRQAWSPTWPWAAPFTPTRAATRPMPHRLRRPPTAANTRTPAHWPVRAMNAARSRSHLPPSTHSAQPRRRGLPTQPPSRRQIRMFVRRFAARSPLASASSTSIGWALSVKLRARSSGVTKWKRLHNDCGQSDGDEFRSWSQSVPTPIKPHPRRTT